VNKGHLKRGLDSNESLEELLWVTGVKLIWRRLKDGVGSPVEDEDYESGDNWHSCIISV
jgi:hypothetical protein